VCIWFHFVRLGELAGFPDVLSLPLQFVLVESMNKFPVGSFEAVLGERGDALPLEPRPDDDDAVVDGLSCCKGGILSLFLSKRLASSNEIFFLFAINSLAKQE